MKKLVTATMLLLLASKGYTQAVSPQGTVNWTDLVYPPPSPGFSITVFGSATAVNNQGNTINDLPPGDAQYNGTPLSGAGFEIGLYVDTSQAAVQSDVLTGTPVATAPFQTGGNAGTWDLTGSFVTSTPNLAPGTPVYVELAAWSTDFGASSYAQAAAATGFVGYSLVSSTPIDLGNPNSGNAPPTLNGLGITDFTIAVPEPSTIALGLLGASAFVMRLRRK